MNKPEDMNIPKRSLEITTGKGAMNPVYLASIKDGKREGHTQWWHPLPKRHMPNT